jgi:hypothetical protein
MRVFGRAVGSERSDYQGTDVSISNVLRAIRNKTGMDICTCSCDEYLYLVKSFQGNLARA